MTLDDRIARSGKWFFVIAALTFVYALVTPFGFVTGSGLVGYTETSGLGAFAPLAAALHVALAAGVVGAYALFGWFAVRGRLWAFVAGICVYAIDAVVFILAIQRLLATGSQLDHLAAEMWYFPLVAHALILTQLVPGLAACLQRERNASIAAQLELQHRLKRALEQDGTPPPPAAVFRYRTPPP